MSLEDKSCQNYNLTGDANKLFNLDVLRAKIQLSKENKKLQDAIDALKK